MVPHAAAKVMVESYFLLNISENIYEYWNYARKRGCDWHSEVVKVVHSPLGSWRSCVSEMLYVVVIWIQTLTSRE